MRVAADEAKFPKERVTVWDADQVSYIGYKDKSPQNNHLGYTVWFKQNCVDLFDQTQ